MQSEKKKKNLFINKYFILVIFAFPVFFLFYLFFYDKLFLFDQVQIIKATNETFKIKPKNTITNLSISENLKVVDLIDGKDTNNNREIITLKSNNTLPELPPIKIENEKKFKNKTDQMFKKNINEENKKLKNIIDKNTSFSSLNTEKKNTNIQAESLLMAQVAAFRDKEKAEFAARILSDKHKDRLNSHNFNVVEFKNSDLINWWRVTTKPIPSSEAEKICDILKRSGQDCILRKP